MQTRHCVPTDPGNSRPLSSTIKSALVVAAVLAAPTGVAQTVGTVVTTRISASEIRAPVQGKLFRIETEAYETEKQSLIGRVNTILLEAESKRRGVTVPELLDEHVHSQVAPPSDAELNVAAEASPALLDTEVLRQIVMGKRRTQARKAFERSLWSRYERELELTFPPPRWHERLDVAGAPRLGPADARVRIVVFSDFECPYCAQLANGLRSLVAKSTDTSVSFRHFPLESHSAALSAAHFATCAHEKGKFWPFHDRLFRRSSKMTIGSIKEAWRSVGLPESEFGECVENEAIKQLVREDIESARRLDLLGTPSVFVNDRLVLTGGNLEKLEDLIFEERNELLLGPRTAGTKAVLGGLGAHVSHIH